MRPRRAARATAVGMFLAAATAIALARTPPPPTRAPAPLDVEIFDRHSGEVLPVHRHRGELYVVGEPGHEYEIRLSNREGGRVLAVTSVDGIDVLSGRTAATTQGGYVIDRYSSASIDGWRKSLDEVAAFYFTRLRDSYAARTGRPDHVGVIGIAMFRERQPVVPMQAMPAPAPPPATAAAAAEGRAMADSARRSPERAESRLGTGHGERRDSRVTETAFERASDTPDAIVRIYYDSYPRLLAQGVIRAPRVVQQRPEPFPGGGFVPDP